MAITELCGKLGADLENAEDILTGEVFSALQKLPTAFLSTILAAASDTNGNAPLGELITGADPAEWEFYFWPTMVGDLRKVAGTEPDLIIKIRDVWIILEAKYLSEKSGDGLEMSELGEQTLVDQLARQLFATHSAAHRESNFAVRVRKHDGHLGRQIVPKADARIWSVYCTNHMVSPRDDLVGSAKAFEQFRIESGGLSSVREVNEQFLWISWHQIEGVVHRLRSSLRQRAELMIAEELLTLLESKNIGEFRGFERCQSAGFVPWTTDLNTVESTLLWPRFTITEQWQLEA